MSYRPLKDEEILYFDKDVGKWRPAVFIMNSIKFGPIVRADDGMFRVVKAEHIRELGPMEESNPNVTFKKEEQRWN